LQPLAAAVTARARGEGARHPRRDALGQRPGKNEAEEQAAGEPLAQSTPGEVLLFVVLLDIPLFFLLSLASAACFASLVSISTAAEALNLRDYRAGASAVYAEAREGLMWDEQGGLAPVPSPGCSWARLFCDWPSSRRHLLDSKHRSSLVPRVQALLSKDPGMGLLRWWLPATLVPFSHLLPVWQVYHVMERAECPELEIVEYDV
jgi:hypothetical protein